MLQWDFPVVAADQVPLQPKTKVPVTKSAVKTVRMSHRYQKWHVTWKPETATSSPVFSVEKNSSKVRNKLSLWCSNEHLFSYVSIVSLKWLLSVTIRMMSPFSQTKNEWANTDFWCVQSSVLVVSHVRGSNYNKPAAFFMSSPAPDTERSVTKQECRTCCI